MRFASLIILLSCAACSTARDMENVCNATDRAGAKDIADPAERAEKTALWLDANVKTKEIKAALGSLQLVPDPQKKAEMLRELAIESGEDKPS